jgi:hypothetical protein
MQTVAFLGRYGHQPVNVVLAMPARRFYMLADEVAELLRREKDSMASRLETDM